MFLELRRREMDHEQRMQRGAITFGGGYSRGGGDAPMIPREPMGQDGMGNNDGDDSGGGLGFNLDFGSLRQVDFEISCISNQNL